MTTEQLQPLAIDPGAIGALELDGRDVPYVDIEDAPYIHANLSVSGATYEYQRSFPVKGHSAVMPQAVADLQAKGMHVLIAERSERYYVYAA
jgi:hypothetical protein